MAQVIEENGVTILRSDWHVEDVRAQCPWLDEYQAMQVMDAIADNHDANYGINWEIIEYTTVEIFPKPDDWKEDQ